MNKGSEPQHLLSQGEPSFDFVLEALTAEATDYVIHFFGLAYYDCWRRQQDDDRSARNCFIAM